MPRHSYAPLQNSPVKQDLEGTYHPSPRQRPRHIYLILSLILNIALLVVPIVGHFRANRPVAIYSPAQSAVEYQVVKFTRGVEDDIPIYEQRPSPEVDEAWRQLYAFSETSVSRSEASQMANRTWPILGAPDHYLVALDVFHQLHCLDMVRQRLHPGHNYTRLPMGHIRHCIGAIRQALMCAADISPVVWQWSDELQIADQRDDIPHVCRDYGKIQAWAKDHHAGAFPDVTVYIGDSV
ncbi:hypothetical protein C8F04DRAFT_1260834 [Mycena alexandri]|uniref:Cyclochlorotine biosynthesis protein O n=1 Tax=Mycena alexandri TaxID=1745969 RepID=A0AAD6X650_9AGAR|nr:hypothetical protein C8F04DRAFT_1260834 [Mycena alexandri]